MKSDVRLRMFGILVTLVFCLIASTLAHAQALSLYDDFSGTSIDAAKWQNLDFVREIRGGKVVSTLRVGGAPGNPENNLSFISPAAILSFQADVRLNAYTPPPGGHVKVRLEGSYYNDGTGGPGDMTGDVLAQLYTLGDSTGVTIQYRVLKCLTPTCGGLNGATNLVGPTTVKPAALGEVHTLAISWNGSVFTFTVDGTPTVVDPRSVQPIVRAAPNVPFKLLQSNVVMLGAGGEGYVTGDFDNVYVNSTLYDDFDGAPYSGPRLDPAKWRDLEFVREIQNGRLVSKTAHAGATNSYTQSNLHFGNERLVTSVKADVRVTEFSSADSAGVQATVFFGYVYNDGSSTGASDGTGDVYALFRVISNNGGALNVSLSIARFNGSTDVQFFSDTVATVNVGETHTIFLTWDGSVFTYGITDLGISRTFDPKPTYPVVKPAVQHLKRLRTRAAMNSDNAYGYIAATFDNVCVNDEAKTLPRLAPFYHTALAGDVTSAGIGLRGSGAGIINLSGIPGGTTIEKAFLYWATVGGSGTFTSPTLNGVPVSGTLIGRSDDPWWGAAQSFAYRADVTGLVTGNGSYTIAGLPAGPLPPANLTVNDSEGASLVVIYSLPGAPARVITINDGALTLSGSRVQYYATRLSGFRVADAPTAAHVTFLIGDGQSSTAEYAGLNTTLLATNAFSGSNGNYWDTRTYDVSSALAGGATSAEAIISTANDSLVWVAAILSVPGTPFPTSLLTVSKSGTGVGTVTSTPAGITCPWDCSESYAPTTNVTLTASAGTNSAFLGWGGACAGISTATCTVALETAKTVTATFAGATDTAAVLSVLVSGPGRVTSGDGRIDCPGNCTDLYGKNSMVTLTALPEGGGSFRGWGGACGGGTPSCTLTLDQAKSVSAAFTGTVAPPAGLALYDDFSSVLLDPTKWSTVREQVREIRNGMLFVAAGGSAPTDNSANTPLRHVSPPTNLTSLQADLRITNATPPAAGGFSRMRIRAAFYNDGTAGTGSLGDVWAQIGIRVYPTGATELYWAYFRCDDADCSLSPTGELGILGPGALNTTYTVRIGWDAAANAGAGQFTFTATPQGGSAIAYSKTPIITPKGAPRTGHLMLRPEATTWTNSPGVEGYTAGTFDNVVINGTLYDAFSGPAIDPAKWRDYEVVRELTSGAATLRSVTPAGKGGQSSQLRLPNPNAVTALAADMALTAMSFGTGNDTAQAGLRATLYNTGTGTPLGDVQAEVKYWTNGSGPGNLQFYLYRSEGSQHISLFNDTLVPSFPLNESHRLLLGWDGAVITYGVDSLVRTFDPRPAAPVAQPPVNPNKVLFVNTNSGGGTASLTAVFDNVAVNPAALAALPGLHPRQTRILAGDVAAAGVGLRGTGAGTLSLTTLPTNATITEATLYWATLGRDGTFTSPTLNGTSVEGVLIGQGDDPIGGAFQAYAYRADVTELVSGNGSYLVAGLPADGPTVNDTEGASLVVLYTVPGAPLRQIAVSDGLATVTSNNMGTQAPIPIPARLPVARAPFTGLRAIDPAGAKLLLLAGDGQPSTTFARDFAGLDGTLLASDPFTGSDGAAWDTKLLDASTALTAGATTATAVVSTLADSVVWVAAILSTPLQSPATYTLSVTIGGSGAGSVSSTPPGIACPPTCSASITADDTVTLTAKPAVPDTFREWRGDCAVINGATCQVLMNGPKSVTAVFSKTFTDSTLTAGTPIKTAHFTELREAINTLRTRCVQCVPVLGAFAWTDANLVARSTPVKAAHLTELRTALAPVYRKKYGSDPVYTSDPNVVAGQTIIKATHLNALRGFVHDSE